jgi:hypothetical protein
MNSFGCFGWEGELYLFAKPPISPGVTTRRVYVGCEGIFGFVIGRAL